MPVHDLPANTQTDSRTALFSCKKRNKYLIHRFRHNAVSVVGDRNHRNTFTPERIHPENAEAVLKSLKPSRRVLDDIQTTQEGEISAWENRMKQIKDNLKS